VNKVICFLFAAFLLTGCMKDDFNDLKNSGGALKLEDVPISSDFDWATTKTIDVQIVGFKTSEIVKSTLTLSAGDNIYYSGFHAISDTLNLKLQVPSATRELIMRFGAIEKTAPIVDSSVNFNYDIESN